MEQQKTLWKNQWLSIKDNDGYFYLHENTRKGTVVVFPFRYTGDDTSIEVLVHQEVCPAHVEDLDISAASITGGIRHDSSPEDAALEELLEEAGYSATIEELIAMGSVYPSKMSDTKAYLFAVDCTGKEQGQALGDGSKFEEGSYSQWISLKDALYVNDALFQTCMARFFLSPVLLNENGPLKLFYASF